MLRGIFNWLYQSVPGSAGGRKELQRTTKKQEESLNSAEVVCRPHVYGREGVYTPLPTGRSRSSVCGIFLFRCPYSSLLPFSHYCHLRCYFPTKKKRWTTWWFSMCPPFLQLHLAGGFGSLI